MDPAVKGTVYGEGDKSFELEDGSTLDGVATTVVTISRINILNFCNTAVVGSAVCNVNVRGSSCKFRAKLLSVFGLKMAKTHPEEVGSTFDS